MSFFLILAASSWKEWLVETIAEHSYAGVFFFLVACGLGFPCPEEVALIGGGYAVFKNGGGPPEVALMISCAMLGVLCGDSILWYIGRRVGQNAERLPLIGRHLTPKRMQKAIRLFEKHGAKAVFFGRFLFGIRAVTFFVSGSLRVPLGKFLLMDGLAGLVSVPISVYLAWYFGAELEDAFAYIKQVDRVILIVVGTAALVVGILIYRRRKELAASLDADSEERPRLPETPPK